MSKVESAVGLIAIVARNAAETEQVIVRPGSYVLMLVSGGMYVQWAPRGDEVGYNLGNCFGRALVLSTKASAEQLAATWNGAPKCTKHLQVKVVEATEAKRIALSGYLVSIRELAELGLAPEQAAA